MGNKIVVQMVGDMTKIAAISIYGINIYVLITKDKADSIETLHAVASKLYTSKFVPKMTLHLYDGNFKFMLSVRKNENHRKK